jgi:hypothetical protein
VVFGELWGGGSGYAWKKQYRVQQRAEQSVFHALYFVSQSLYSQDKDGFADETHSHIGAREQGTLAASPRKSNA